MLVVDQFEELWTHCGPDDRANVLPALATAGPDVVVLGLRADFYPAAAREPVLAPVLAAGPLVVGPLTDTDLETVVVAPAEKAGATVPDELVRVLLADLTPRTARAATDPGTLPLRSHALLGTWQRARRRTLTVADYLAAGGVSGAVQQSAEEVYAGLTPEQQVLARRIFLRLVTVDDDTQTRRRTPWNELAIGDIADVTAVVDRFAARRLLTVDEDTVQLSHEVLLVAWERLREWIDADRAGLGVHRRPTRAAQVWQDSGRDPGALPAGTRLQLFEEWADDDRRDALNPLELEFVEAGIAHRDRTVRAEQRRTRVLRRLVGALAVVPVVAVTAAVAAVASGLHANGQRAEAQRARDEAPSRQIATVSAQLRDVDPAPASQLAVAGYQVGAALEARSALLDATAVHTPTRLAGAEGGLVARIDPDARIVASAGSDGVVRLWPIIGGQPAAKPIAELPASVDGSLYALEFGPDGSTLAVEGQGGARLWDVRDVAAPRILSDLADPDRVIYGFAFDPGGTRLAAGDAGPSGVDSAVGHRWMEYGDDAALRSAAGRFDGALSERDVRAGRSHSRGGNDTSRGGPVGADRRRCLRSPPVSAVVRRGSGTCGIRNTPSPTPYCPRPGLVSTTQHGHSTVRSSPGGPDRLVRLWNTDIEDAADRVCGSAGSPIMENEWERYLPGASYRNPCAGE